MGSSARESIFGKGQFAPVVGVVTLEASQRMHRRFFQPIPQYCGEICQGLGGG